MSVVLAIVAAMLSALSISRQPVHAAKISPAPIIDYIRDLDVPCTRIELSHSRSAELCYRKGQGGPDVSSLPKQSETPPQIVRNVNDDAIRVMTYIIRTAGPTGCFDVPITPDSSVHSCVVLRKGIFSLRVDRTAELRLQETLGTTVHCAARFLQSGPNLKAWLSCPGMQKAEVQQQVQFEDLRQFYIGTLTFIVDYVIKVEATPVPRPAEKGQAP